MTPIEYFTENHQTIREAFDQTGGQVKQAWNILQGTLPEMADAMSFNSFKAYLPAFVAGFHAAMDQVKQVEQDSLTELEKARHELNVSQAEVVKQSKDLSLVKQELNIKQGELETAKAELDRVKQELNNQGPNEIKQDGQEAPKTVDGWSVQFSGGYYRAFRKINGQVKGVYLGKRIDLEAARAKVRAKEKEIR